MHMACASRGDRHLGYSSRHTQVPVPATMLVLVYLMFSSFVTAYCLFFLLLLGVILFGSQLCEPAVRGGARLSRMQCLAHAAPRGKH